MASHACNRNIWETERDRQVTSLKPSWATERVEDSLDIDQDPISVGWVGSMSSS